MEKKEKSFIDYMLEDSRKDENPFWEFLARVFWYRTLAKIPDLYRWIKWSLQGLLRRNHIADCDTWEMAFHLAPIILAGLKAFRDSSRHGYPCCYCEYEENYGWQSKEEYEKEKAEGKVLGGGPEAWEKDVNEMVFAFDFYTNYEASDKKRDAMLARYGLIYPHQKIPENRRVHYAYRYGKEGDKHVMSSDRPPDDPENAEREFLGEDVSYYNFDLEMQYYERARKGAHLFAEHFLSLWD